MLHVLFIVVLCLVSAVEGYDKSGCPVSGKCPYYAAHKGEHASQKGCPLETGGCPYYKKHSKDQTAEDIIASDSAAACPMEKCPYFQVRFCSLSVTEIQD